MVHVDFDGVSVDGVAHNVPFTGKGVAEEVAGFAASVAGSGSDEASYFSASAPPSSSSSSSFGDVRKMLSPGEAVADLEVLEEMLKSGGQRADLKLQG